MLGHGLVMLVSELMAEEFCTSTSIVITIDEHPQYVLHLVMWKSSLKIGAALIVLD